MRLFRLLSDSWKEFIFWYVGTALSEKEIGLEGTFAQLTMTGTSSEKYQGSYLFHMEGRIGKN